MGDLTDNFSEWEFRCKCGCGTCIVDPGFILKLQKARDLADIPFPINSGCRCWEHNRNTGGSTLSDHLTHEDMACEGADIFCDRSSNRYKIIEAAFLLGFRRVGIHKTFVHLGTAKRNPQGVLWVY